MDVEWTTNTLYEDDEDDEDDDEDEDVGRVVVLMDVEWTNTLYTLVHLQRGLTFQLLVCMTIMYGLYTRQIRAVYSVESKSCIAWPHRLIKFVCNKHTVFENRLLLLLFVY